MLASPEDCVGRAAYVTPGTYVLVLHLPSRRDVVVGGARSYLFDAGYYYYCGSALNGLEARLARHYRQEKCLRWHVDYFLRLASISAVWAVRGSVRLECCAQRALSDLGCLPIRGFGSSDCRCPGHLLAAPDPPGLSLFNERMRRLGPLGVPSARWTEVPEDWHTTCVCGKQSSLRLELE